MENQLAKSAVKAVQGISVLETGPLTETVRLAVLHQRNEVGLQTGIADIVEYVQRLLLIFNNQPLAPQQGNLLLKIKSPSLKLRFILHLQVIFLLVVF